MAPIPPSLSSEEANKVAAKKKTEQRNRLREARVVREAIKASEHIRLASASVASSNDEGLVIPAPLFAEVLKFVGCGRTLLGGLPLVSKAWRRASGGQGLVRSLCLRDARRMKLNGFAAFFKLIEGPYFSEVVRLDLSGSQRFSVGKTTFAKLAKSLPKLRELDLGKTKKGGAFVPALGEAVGSRLLELRVDGDFAWRPIFVQDDEGNVLAQNSLTYLFKTALHLRIFVAKELPYVFGGDVARRLPPVRHFWNHDAFRALAHLKNLEELRLPSGLWAKFEDCAYPNLTCCFAILSEKGGLPKLSILDLSGHWKTSEAGFTVAIKCAPLLRELILENVERTPGTTRGVLRSKIEEFLSSHTEDHFSSEGDRWQVNLTMTPVGHVSETSAN